MIYKCKVHIFAFVYLMRILSKLSAFSSVSNMWVKKNAVTKERVAELVDDTYRSVPENIFYGILGLAFVIFPSHVMTKIC